VCGAMDALAAAEYYVRGGGKRVVDSQAHAGAAGTFAPRCAREGRFALMARRQSRAAPADRPAARAHCAPGSCRKASPRSHAARRPVGPRRSPSRLVSRVCVLCWIERDAVRRSLVFAAPVADLLAPAQPSLVLPDRLLQMDVAGKHRAFQALAHVRGVLGLLPPCSSDCFLGSGPSTSFAGADAPSRSTSQHGATGSRRVVIGVAAGICCLME
jgi:hypothetical protein